MGIVAGGAPAPGVPARRHRSRVGWGVAVLVGLGVLGGVDGMDFAVGSLQSLKVDTGRTKPYHLSSAAAAEQAHKLGRQGDEAQALRKRVPLDWVARYDNATQYMHAPSIEALRNNTVVAVWQAAAGEYECSGSQHLQYAIGELVGGGGNITGNAGAAAAVARATITWGPAQPVPLPEDMLPAWGPVLFLPPRSRDMWLFFARGTGDCHSKRTKWCDPTDRRVPGGDIVVTQLNLATGRWDGSPRVIYDQAHEGGIPKVTTGRPVVLASGRWLLPFHRENALFDEADPACSALAGTPSAGVLATDDDGRTWQALGAIRSMLTWLIEPAIVELKVRKLGEDANAQPPVLMLLRSSAQRVWATQSTDGGQTWEHVHQMFDLPNPDAKVSVIRLSPGGELAAAFNDHTEKRDYLRVAVSTDNGHTWIRVATVETSNDNHDKRQSGLRMHYPSLAQNGCLLHVAYARSYSKGSLINTYNATGMSQGIRLATIDLKRVLTRESSFLDQERGRSYLLRDGWRRARRRR